VRAKEFLGVMARKVDSFNKEFKALIREGFPSYWELDELSPWDQYKQRLVEEKN